MGLVPLTYRRPSHARAPSNSSQSSLGGEKGDVSLRSGRSCSSAGIPPALSFDKIMEGGTCPPCTIRDFMNYLMYIEHSAENLQFFLWHRDYVTRFEQVPECERLLAPEWTQAQEDEAAARIQKEAAEKMRRVQPVEIFRGTDFEKPALQGSVSVANDDSFSHFSTPPMTPRDRDHDSLYTGSNAGSNMSGLSTSYQSLAGDAYVAAGVEKPFTIQPFRAEIDRVVATYIAHRSPRQLNLSSKEQKTLLHALSNTTHPSAFRSVAASIESNLRLQAHPNFIRWSICNANPARVTFAWCLGIAILLSATVAAVLLTLSRAPRGYRALAAIGWVAGFATVMAARKGMCVVLHGLHHRHVRPWEFFEPDFDSDAETGQKGEKSSETLETSNSYEEEPWIVKYDKRNIIRKVFDRQVWVQEPALRRVQDTIFLQSVLAGVLFSGVLVGLFVGVPGGGFF
ncbi:hypothetical protein CONLIGDRAFT_643355 [Coniochaeta ligniaria NRRL 30616]|uniref:Regulator of G protein signaling superfamily n=1 Tax=Coniochaeta ligniaria NRRL 30616 TaxID=1408157 RepID=A0A1J7IUN0_9PEZI|nr:hypothetical protein CONLIGDRAFT_643355 [Coniochaeta ligniaria NRRL 30616]